MSPPPEPQQKQQRKPPRSRDGWNALCWVVLTVLLFAVFVAFSTWSPTPRHPPRFTVATLSISGGQVAFNVSGSNPNGHVGISYKGATRASLLFYDAIVASGQANRSTTSITGVLNVLDQPSFSIDLRVGGGRLPLHLQLTTAISFRRLNIFPGSVVRNMQVICVVLVGRDGRLLRETVGEPCDTYFWPLNDR